MDVLVHKVVYRLRNSRQDRQSERLEKEAESLIPKDGHPM